MRKQNRLRLKEYDTGEGLTLKVNFWDGHCNR